MSNALKPALIFFSILAFFTGCAGTKLTHTHMDKSFEGESFSNILVIGIADKDRNRRLFEQRFVAQLKSAGIKAASSADTIPMPPDLELEKSTILQAVGKFNNDGVIITHLAGTAQDETIIRSHDAGGNLYDYYGTRYNDFQDAGYSRTSTKTWLETRLFDVRTEKLVWSGRSKTWNRDSVRQVIDDVMRVVIEDLNKRNLISPK